MNHTFRLLSFLMAIITVAVLGGCLEDMVNVEADSNDREVTLAGRVLDDHDGTPVADAAVSLRAIDRSDLTGADGGYRLPSLAPGNYRVEVEAAGYLGVGAYLDLDVGDKAETDHRHQDIRLLSRQLDLTFVVVAADDMDAVPGVEVTLVGAEMEHDQPGFVPLVEQVGLSAVTDDEGRATLTGLPLTDVLVIVSDVDAASDEVGGLSGRMLSLDVRTVDDPYVVPLPSMTGTDVPHVISSNAPSSNDPLTDSVLYFEFDQPMVTDEQVTTVSIYGLDTDQYRYYWVGSNRLEIAILVPVDIWAESYVTAFGDSGIGVRVNSYFNWRANPGTGGWNLPVCEEIVGDLMVESVVANIDYDTRGYDIAWTALNCAEGYRVYARDDAANPAWVAVDDLPHDYDVGLIRRHVMLPSQFDRFVSDGIITPLAGTAVELCVLPANASDPSPGLPHAAVTITDQHPPALADLGQCGFGLNLTGEPVTFEIIVDFSEFIGEGVADPELEIIEAGGDPAFTLDPAAGTWIWDPGMHRGRFRFTLQPGDDATDDQYRVTVTDLTDLAGNVAVGTQQSLLETIYGSYFYDFEDGAAGWTVVGTGWEIGNPTSGPGGAYSGTQCWATTLGGSYANSTNTQLLSPELTIAFFQPVLRYYASIQTESCCDRVHVEVDAGNGWVNLETYQGSAANWQLYEHDLSPYQGQTVKIRFHFTSDGSVVNPGIYIDDVAVEPGL